MFGPYVGHPRAMLRRIDVAEYGEAAVQLAEEQCIRGGMWLTGAFALLVGVGVIFETFCR